MKVYCDRLGTVTVTPGERPTIECPKCKGTAFKSPHTGMFDCHKCGRGWSEVPDSVTNAHEAEEYLNK